MKPVLLLSLCTVLFPWITQNLLGQADSSQPALFSQPVIMYVGHVNPDCVPDTLIGYYQKDLRVRPAFLCWGRAFDSAGAPICDSGTYDTRIGASQQRDTTWFIYPDWDRLQVNVSVLQFNTNDTLIDLLFWTRGVASAVITQDGLELRDSADISASDSVVYVDTSRSLVVFGQIALSTRREVKLKNIGGAQSRPFAAMQLGYAVDLVDPKRRDHSGKSSWRIHKLRQVVDTASVTDTTTAPPPEELATVPEPPLTARIYPNPAIYSTSVEVKTLPAGTYIVELVAADGAGIATYQLDLDAPGYVLETIDLTALPSGYYFIRVRTRTQSYGDYPIIVVR